MPELKTLLISDTHGTHWHKNFQIDGEYDLLIHAGDFTNHGREDEIADFMLWIEALDQFKDIIYIAGNHDLGYHAESLVTLSSGARLHYLYNSCVSIDGIKFYGSPCTPRFFDWAFMYDKDEAEDLWSLIPTDTDVLITHGPPHGVFDRCPGDRGIPEHAGCPALWRAVEKIPSIQLHVFGHIHEGYGAIEHAGGRTSVNAASIYQGLRRTPVEFSIRK